MDGVKKLLGTELEPFSILAIGYPGQEPVPQEHYSPQRIHVKAQKCQPARAFSLNCPGRFCGGNQGRAWWRFTFNQAELLAATGIAQVRRRYALPE